MQFSLARQPHYRFFLLFLFFAGVMAYPTGRAFAAISKVDSLQKQLFGTDDISKKISLYLEISKTFEAVHADSANHYWKEAQNLAVRMKNDKPLADVYAQAAFFALKQNQLDQAFLNFTLAAKYYSSAGEQARSVTMKSMLGAICLVRDNIASAMSYYMEVIEDAERMKLYKTLPHALNNVGNIYMDSEDFDQALGYYTRALQLFRKTGDSYNSVYPLLNLGECYFYLGNLDMAQDYIRQSLEPARKANDNVLEARGLMLLGMIRSKKKDYPGAIAFFNSSEEILKKQVMVNPGPSNIQYSELLVRLGEAWYRSGDLIRSKTYTLQGYSVAKSMRQVRQVMLAAVQLSAIHESQHRADSALFYYKIYKVEADSLAKSGNVRAVKLLEVRQEFEKKQKENELKIALARSAKHTLLIVYISSGVVLMAVILILFLMLKLERQKKVRSEIEKLGLNEKLEFQNKELTTNVMYLTRMNELVMMIAEKLKKMEMEERSENAKIVQSIVSELERTSNPDNWKEFEVRFQQVHTDFYRKLGDQFPDLTPNELKLCAFLRLNMSTKEISSITYQSQNSIMVARSRLRQKLGIAKDENLVVFLSQI